MKQDERKALIGKYILLILGSVTDFSAAPCHPL